jgi:hypothetical protein
MNCRDYRNPGATADGIRGVLASGSSGVNARQHGDAVLGAVALAAMALILAWVVTGIELLAIVALLVVLEYLRMAGTLKPAKLVDSLEARRYEREPNEGALWKARSERLPARTRRSAYEGLAD